MAQPNSALSPPAAAEPVLDDRPVRELALLLGRAARLAAEHGLDSETFMEAAWNACLDARPGLREKLEDKELRKELRRLRKRGLVGAA